MRQTLPYFSLGGGIGGNQDWFTDPMMKLGGCAAECACDSSIYFALYREKQNLCPFDVRALTKEAYIDFSARMKPYLRPRWSGIDRPQIYIDGYGSYLRDCGETSLRMEALSGDCTEQQARAALRERIDAGFPVPCLLLNHSDPAFSDYEWHWFLLTGYDDADKAFDAVNESSGSADKTAGSTREASDATAETQGAHSSSDKLTVRAVTYSAEHWLSFSGLWNTGRQRRGGLILYKEF